MYFIFFFSSRRRHTRYWRDWSSDVCSSDLAQALDALLADVLGPAQRRERRLPRRKLARLEAGLGGDEHVVRVRGERLGDDLLALPVPVDVRAVQELHAPRDHAADQLHGERPVADPLGGASPGDAHGPEAEATRPAVADRDRADHPVLEHPAVSQRHGWSP